MALRYLSTASGTVFSACLVTHQIKVNQHNREDLYIDTLGIGHVVNYGIYGSVGFIFGKNLTSFCPYIGIPAVTFMAIKEFLNHSRM